MNLILYLKKKIKRKKRKFYQETDRLMSEDGLAKVGEASLRHVGPIHQILNIKN